MMELSRLAFSRSLAGLFAASVFAANVVAACGGSQAEQPAPATAQKSTASAGDGEACGEYAKRLCLELGPRSDACRSVLGVVAIMPDSACNTGIAEFESTKTRIAELRQACATVADRVCSELGAESESCKAIRGDLPQIPPGHCAALLRDQDQLVNVLRQREALETPISEERWAELGAGQPPGFGASDARVMVVQFSDFQCPFCAEAAKTIHRLEQDYGSRIRFVFRQFPLSFHPDAHTAAKASLAAHAQGKFWQYHDALFANQDALGRDALVDHAREVGLDVEAFRTTLDASATAQRVDEDLELGQAVQVQGTPTLFVDKQRVANPLDYDDVSRAVEQALAKQN